jgi:hypothetical protein
MISHDLAVNDFRITILEATARHPIFSLVNWVPEGDFLSRPDKISYADQNNKKQTRYVRPDAFFAINYIVKPYPFAFLLEIDMGTEDNPRFAREKVRPGVAYLKGDVYRQRFGVEHGRFLVVTTSQRRLQNMKAQAERSGGQGLFYFTTFADITPDSVLSDPIWWLTGRDAPQAILP